MEIPIEIGRGRSGFEVQRAEAPNYVGKISNNRHFCARSLTFVPDWLRRIIGYSLVGSIHTDPSFGTRSRQPSATPNAAPALNTTFTQSSVPPLRGRVIERNPLDGSRMKFRKSGSALSFKT
jgi:hypothetical protein